MRNRKEFFKHREDFYKSQHKQTYRTPPGLGFEPIAGDNKLVPVVDFDFEEVEKKLGWKQDLSAFTEREGDLLAAAKVFGRFLRYVAGGKSLERIGLRFVAFMAVYLPDFIGEKMLSKVAVKYEVSRQNLQNYISRLKVEMKKPRPSEQENGAEQ